LVLAVTAALGVPLLVAASAQAATLSVAATPPNPVVIPPFNANTGGGSVVVTITVTGTADAGENPVLAYVQPGDGSCAPTAAAEPGGAAGTFELSLDQYSVGMGPFSTSAMYTFSTAGDYRVCAYLYSSTDSQGGPAGTPVTANTEIQLSSGTSPGSGTRTKCLVPRVVGRTVKGADAALAAAGCRAGSVTRRKSGKANRGRVIAQSEPPGTREPSATAVNLVVGR